MLPRMARNLILSLALLAAGFFAFVAMGERPVPETRDTSGEDRRPLVTTQAVTRHSGGLDILTDGLVVPFREITAAAEVSGTVVFKSPQCNEGTYVQAGTKLIEIDPSSYRLELRRLESELVQATTSLKELDVELKNAEELIPLAERELAIRNNQQERFQSLRPQGVISQEQLEDAERGSIAARNALIEAKRLRDSLLTRKASVAAAIEVGRVGLEKAALDLKRATVVAPVSGVIIRHDVEKDSYVTVGSKLFAIEDTEKVEVRCNLRMEEMRWIWQQKEQAETFVHETSSSPGDVSGGGAAAGVAANNHTFPTTEVTVKYELGGRLYTWHGMLDRYDGLGLNEKTRMIPCRIIVDKPNEVSVDGEVVSMKGPRSLVRGMYVNLAIHTQPKATLLQVPAIAVQPGTIVWRVQDGKLERVKLQIAQNRDEQVLVDAQASGLTAGDQLVTSPLRAAYSGLEVREEAAR